MARIAHEVMLEAERVFRRADALAGGMEPHLLKRVNDSAIEPAGRGVWTPGIARSRSWHRQGGAGGPPA